MSRSSRLQRPPRRSLGFRSVRMTTKVIAIAVISILIVPVAAGGVAIATLVFGDLPGKLPKQKPAIVALPSYVVDAAGNSIGVYRQFDLTVPTQPADIPQVLEDAVVAAEDKRFWEHSGIDVRGIARAAWVDYQAGDRVQGASTITQQYVKKTYLTDDRSWSRKLREAVLATQLERRMPKEDILFNYLNTIYFGSGAYGAGAAAISYFGKPVSQLNLSEAATLAGLIPAPHAWSPRIDSPKAEERRRLTLAKMLEQRLITQAQYDEALPLGLWLVVDGPPPAPATLIQPQPTKGSGVYPYFVDWVEQELVAKYGPEKVYKGGLRIETTLDPRLQAMAQEAVGAQLDGTSAPLDMALVSVEPGTGLVRAMVGGRDYNSSQVNLATGGTLGFQPGSSFKTFVLAAAFEQGIVPETVYSAPSQFRVPGCDGEGCYLGNYDGGGGGRMNLRRATASSVNTVFAQLILDVGVGKTAEMANRLGIASVKPDGDYGVSLALGSAEVTPTRDGRRLRHPGQPGGACRPDPDPAGLRQGRPPARGQLGPPGHPGAVGERGRQRHQRAHRRRPLGYRHGGSARPTGRRQDRHRRGVPGGLVRRLHPAAVDGGVDGLRRRAASAARHQRGGLGDRRQPAHPDVGGLHAAGHGRHAGRGLPGTGQAAGRAAPGAEAGGGPGRQPGAGPTSGGHPRHDREGVRPAADARHPDRLRRTLPALRRFAEPAGARGGHGGAGGTRTRPRCRPRHHPLNPRHRAAKPRPPPPRPPHGEYDPTPRSSQPTATHRVRPPRSASCERSWGRPVEEPGVARPPSRPRTRRSSRTDDTPGAATTRRRPAVRTARIRRPGAGTAGSGRSAGNGVTAVADRDGMRPGRTPPSGTSSRPPGGQRRGRGRSADGSARGRRGGRGRRPAR